MGRRASSGSVKDENMRTWLRGKAKRTPTDVCLFYTFFRQRGEDRPTARDLALKMDGQAWHGAH